MTTPPPTTHEFRKALGQFPTGVTVVTVERESGQVHGMTANAFTSVSLHPMLVLVCVDHRAKLLPLLQKKKRFGISVLREDQEAISEYFAKREQSAEAEQRLSIRYHWTPNGIPVLEGALLDLTCTLVDSYVAGDHTVFIGEVETATIHDGKPLLFFRGEYRGLAGNP